MRSRLLIAWELGSGLGHIACVQPIVARLREKGIDPIVAVPDPALAAARFGARAPRLTSIMPLTSARDASQPLNSLADILLQQGFARVPELREAIRGWQDLLRRERTEAVMVDYAPVAQLAAWLMELPMVTWSTPFSNPPVPLPFIRPWEAAPVRALAASERRLLHNVNEIVRGAGHKPLANLGTWLHAPLRFAKGTTHTNAFGFEPVGYLGPFGHLQAPEPPGWLDSGHKRVLCYLRWSRGIPNIMKGLAAADRELVCVITGAPARWANAPRKTRMKIITTPVSLTPLIRAADVVVSHGSANVACEALAAGKPQLMFPFDSEKALIARRMGGLGVALALRPGRKVSDAKHALQRLLEEPAFANAARSIADSYRPADWAAALDKMIDHAAG